MASAAELVSKANELFVEEEYEGALDLYSQAVKLEPQASDGHQQRDAGLLLCSVSCELTPLRACFLSFSQSHPCSLLPTLCTAPQPT